MSTALMAATRASRHSQDLKHQNLCSVISLHCCSSFHRHQFQRSRHGAPISQEQLKEIYGPPKIYSNRLILSFNRQQFFTLFSSSTIFSKYCCQQAFFPMSKKILSEIKIFNIYPLKSQEYLLSEFFQSFHIQHILKKIQFFLSYYKSIFSLKILQFLILFN